MNSQFFSVFLGGVLVAKFRIFQKIYRQGCKEQEGEKRGPKPKLKFKAHIIIIIM
jgi:hypothetical protein